MPGCLLVCLPARLSAGRPTAWPARLACPPGLPAGLLAGRPADLPVNRPPACLSACMLSGWAAVLPARWPAGLAAWPPAFQAACSRSQHTVNIQSTSSQHPVNIQSTCAVKLMKLLTFSILRRRKLVLPSRHHLYIIEIMLIGSACAPFVPD